jgi:hypothetical protein
LALASGGGHWEQLMLLRPAFEGCDVSYATTLIGVAEQSGLPDAHLIADCNRTTKLSIIRSSLDVLLLVTRLRPHIVISTGALPGLLGIAIGRKIGARTIWVDSIANAEEMSQAGKKARSYADLWMSQWPHVAEAAKAQYAGAVL